MICWRYKTIHVDLKKDGILGSPFLDEEELELSLCRHGQDGWELVTVLEVQDGLVALCKQPYSGEDKAEAKPLAASIRDERAREDDIDEPVDAAVVGKTDAKPGAKIAVKPPKLARPAEERSTKLFGSEDEDDEKTPSPGPSIDNDEGDEEGSGLSSIKIE